MWINDYLGWGTGVQAWVAGKDYKRTQGNFYSDGYVHHLDYSDGFMGVHMSQTHQNEYFK